MDDWSSLRSFSRLKKLQMRDVTVGTGFFWFSLVDLCLTKLAVVDVLFPTDVPLLGVICLITSVSALELRPISRKPLSVPCCIMPSMSHLTQLTRLSLEVSESLAWSPSMRRMIHLDIHTRYPASQQDLLQATENMPPPSANPEDREPTWSLLHPELRVSRNEASAIAQPDGRECGSDPVRGIG